MAKVVKAAIVRASVEGSLAPTVFSGPHNDKIVEIPKK